MTSYNCEKAIVFGIKMDLEYKRLAFTKSIEYAKEKFFLKQFYFMLLS